MFTVKWASKCFTVEYGQCYVLRFHWLQKPIGVIVKYGQWITDLSEGFGGE